MSATPNGDTLEQATMAAAPSKSEYAAFSAGTVNPTEVAKKKLYDDNKKMVAIIILGHTYNHGLAMMESTVTTDQAQG